MGGWSRTLIQSLRSQLLSGLADLAELGALAMASPEGRRMSRADEDGAWSPMWRRLAEAAQEMPMSPMPVKALQQTIRIGVVELVEKAILLELDKALLLELASSWLTFREQVHTACVCRGLGAKIVQAGLRQMHRPMAPEEHPLQACVASADLDCPVAAAAPSPLAEARC